MKKYIERRRNPAVNIVCDAYCLELGKDTVTKQTVNNCFQRIGRKTITYGKSFLLRKRVLLSQRKVGYVEDIIVTRDMDNLGMSRREMIQTI